MEEESKDFFKKPEEEGEEKKSVFEEREEKEEEPLAEVEKEEPVEEKEELTEKKEEKKPLFESKEEKPEEEAAIKPIAVWQILTAVLAVLLVISIFTYGFRGAPEVTRAVAEEPQEEPEPTSPPTPTEPSPAEPGRVDVSADDDPTKGLDTAKVTMIEFSDFQCPFCGRFYTQTLPQIEKDYIETGKVKYVFRDFPLSFHQNAQKSAEAAECADEQGKFWDYHDRLFENQESLDTDSLKKYADELGLDTEKFNDCLDSGKYTEEVQKDFKDGQQAGVRGTPAFFINGILVSGAQPFENFKQVIDAELAE